MRYRIHAISPYTGCVMLVYNEAGKVIGVAPIEAGDYERAKEILSPEDYEKVCAIWVPDLLARRKAEIEIADAN